MMTERGDLQLTEAAWNQSRATTMRSTLRTGLFGLVAIPLISAPAVALAQLAVGGWARVPVACAFIAVVLAPLMLVLVHQRRRKLGRTDELMQRLASELHQATDAARTELARSGAQVRRQEFEARLGGALEMAEGEPEVVEVIERALALTVPASPVELLLADNSHAHITRLAYSSPTGEPPRCTVDSPDRCPAARRAQTQRYRDSDDLDACPKLRGRGAGPCSAVCVPVSIMGRTVGVIHATGEVDAAIPEDRVAELGTLANLAGARIGLLRMMAETQLQAATDSLTGLLNRRALESEMRKVRESGATYAVAMGDLDHFKELNDVYGHDTGDRALRLFAQTLRGALRHQDVVCRFGGEEFVVILPHCDADQAMQALEGVRTRLGAAIATAGAPRFTASFGVVGAAADDEFPDLLAKADAALFRAKREGRDRAVLHGEWDTADLAGSGGSGTRAGDRVLTDRPDERADESAVPQGVG
ncbi:MAG TPA: sensor domain-containing diguanylate cyclase [Acidimicrobiales bacterium]|jgi:diguanylate cyclase (GGDEF)-like protein